MEVTFVPNFVKIGQAIAWTNWSGQRKKANQQKNILLPFFQKRF